MRKILISGYPLIILFLTLFSFLFIDFNFLFLKPLYTGFGTSKREIVTLVYSFLIIIFFGLYILSIKHYQYFTGTKMKILFVFLLFLIFSYPAMISYDIFNYIATSKVAFYYHENPYLTMPIEFIGDPILQFTRASNKFALYGPMWILLSGFSYVLSFGNYLISIINLKILVGLFYLGEVFLIWRISRNYLSVILFALNPLVIIETFLSGHNDIVMMFFALASFLFLRNKKLLASVLFLLISFLIKYSTLFLFPVYIYVFLKIKKKEKIDWDMIYYLAFVSMGIIFLLSIFREEIYPWYAIWPFSFLVLIPKRKLLINLFLAVTFGLTLSYLPYMYTGSYFGLSRVARIIFTFLPPILILIFYKFLSNAKKFI